MPLVHDSGISLLQAATNTNPDPVKNEPLIAMTNGSALIAEAGPEGTAADVSPTASNGQISLYVVRPGDSVSEIADMFGVTVNTILWANNLKSASAIKPGDTLLILPVSGLQHTVTKGETIASIAKKFNADAGDIALYNGLDTNAHLAAGTAIIIPGGEMPPPPAPVRKTTPSGSRRVAATGPVNPYRGGSGAALSGFFGNPLPGGLVTQGLHGWNGFDIGAHTGTPIYAAAAGRVIVARTSGWNGGYGSYVVIDHGNGTQTLYAHMSQNISSVGEQISRGALIGYVGSTGESTGSHLHFEVRGAKNPFSGCDVGEVDTACFMY